MSLDSARSRALLVAFALLAAACGDDSATDAGAATMDAGLDAGAPDAGVDAGTDASVADAGSDDAGTLDAALPDAALPDAGGPPDAALPDAAVSDAGFDAGPFDAGPPTDCASAGGACVAVVPGACATGVVGDATWYSCGGGLGVMCCLPANTPPECRAIGSRSEGWYRPDGTRVCFASCAGHAARCEAIGTRSEGWYTDAVSAGCMTIPVDRLVEWTMCAP